ncbi:MAG: restriction endonuclease subunit S [Rickettsiales bacterium]
MKQVKGRLVPKLRFKEFVSDGNLENEKIGNLCKITTGKLDANAMVENGQYRFYTCAKDYYFIDKYAFDTEALLISGNGANVGYIHYYKGKFNAYQRTYVLDQFTQDIFFIKYYLERNLSKRIATEKKDGNTPYIVLSSISEMAVMLPKDKKEQQKIADCLSSLDELIETEDKKLEALQRHKKGLMQELFPSEGQTLPKRRFREFNHDGDWEEKKLGDICEILNNRRQPISSNNREKGQYPYYGASGIVDYVKDYIFDERLVLVGEDGAKWGSNEKTAFIAEGKYWVNNHAHVLKPIQINDVLLINFLVMTDLKPFITGAAPPKLTLGKLKTISIPLPRNSQEQEEKSKLEQQKIADCLSSVDDLITSQEQKIDALKTHKKGLMQQLFPNPDN